MGAQHRGLRNARAGQHEALPHGALPALEPALYFSTVTFVALGYGDIVLGPQWRMISAIEAANGVILIAWSTAFLFSVTARLRALEHTWLEPKA